MLNTLFVFILGSAVIVVAGIFLAKFADAIADVTGWGRHLILGAMGLVSKFS